VVRPVRLYENEVAVVAVTEVYEPEAAFHSKPQVTLSLPEAFAMLYEPFKVAVVPLSLSILVAPPVVAEIVGFSVVALPVNITSSI
jgi:hypothetical protein